MIIRIDTIDNMILTLSDFLGLNKNYLLKVVFDFNLKSQTDGFLDIEKLENLSNQFMLMHCKKEIDEIYFCHLTRSIDCPNELMSLSKLLTTNKSFFYY